jgi:hypothetical protein
MAVAAFAVSICRLRSFGSVRQTPCGCLLTCPKNGANANAGCVLTHVNARRVADAIKLSGDWSIEPAPPPTIGTLP